jgi:hypothetical protein
VPPAAILEWKMGRRDVYEPDVEWLTEYSVVYPGFVGYAVTVNRPGVGSWCRVPASAAGHRLPSGSWSSRVDATVL